MNWKPRADVDEDVRNWMKAKGWEVTTTDYHFGYRGRAQAPSTVWLPHQLPVKLRR